ncbi:uncharacterized protein HKW66_Vig0002660 [Vigna angularis]|uniref:Uncharacterized protein n=1 Tax=Phaseolus angularis TaxID=3914 RepID=A0A8T0LDM9_PHAAN|nr:uncharacterized protein HKW66_Vig0002660 [Vigna angularis]
MDGSSHDSRAPPSSSISSKVGPTSIPNGSLGHFFFGHAKPAGWWWRWSRELGDLNERVLKEGRGKKSSSSVFTLSDIFTFSTIPKSSKNEASYSDHFPHPSFSNSTDLSAVDDPIDEVDFVDETLDPPSPCLNPSPRYYFDPLTASIRRSFLSPPSLRQSRTHNDLPLRSFPDHDPFKAAFASDDVPIDDAVRNMATCITIIENMLLLKNSPLRDG